MYITKEKMNKEIEKYEKQNESYERELAIKEVKNKYKKSNISATKLILFYLFIMCNIVLAFSMYVMVKFENLECLSLLITSIVAQFFGYLLYIIKSKAENTVGGITYDLAMLEKQSELEITSFDDEVEEESEE